VALFADTGSSSVIPSPDSTLGPGLESMESMKRAALYARVSTDAQQKEATVESQLSELKRQIASAGQVLVKEYIDDGISGTLLDRPALNQMRTDLKTGMFDSIYFLAADRIAREVESSRTSGDVRRESAKWAIADLDQVAIANRDFMCTCPS
jgi:hypothetical protein